MPTSKEVFELIKRFERNRDAYRSSDYNEAQVRLELINPPLQVKKVELAPP